MSAPSGPSWPCCRSAATTRGGRWGSSSCACTSSTGSTSTARRREASSRAAAVGLRPVKDAVDRRQQARRELGGDLGGTAPCPGPARCGRVDPRRAAGACSLYVQDGKLKHHYSMLGVLEYTQESETPLPTGEVSVEVVFAADEPKPATGGEVTLLVNGEPVASGRMEHTLPGRFSGYAGMDIGCDNGLVSIAATPTRRRSGSPARSSRSPSTSPRTSARKTPRHSTSTRLRPSRHTRRAPER